MRVSAALRIALTASAILVTAGCGLTDKEPSSPPCSSEVFNLARHPAPLGTPDSFVAAFDDAVAQRLESATMAEMVGRAGWSPEWDRAIYISARTSDAELKEEAGTNLELACLAALPSAKDNNSDLLGPSVTLFLSNGKPVQAEWWNGQTRSLRFNGKKFLTPETVVRFDPELNAMAP